MKKIRICMLGCGLVSDLYAPMFRYLEEGELSAAADINEQTARAMAEKYGVGKVYTSVEQVADDPDIDAVIVGSPPNFHAAQIELLASKGKHILCEKPMASTVADCQAIIDSCKKYNVKLQLAHMKRFMRGNQKVKAAVDSGILGKIFMAECHWDCAVPGLFGTYREQEITGGGSLQDHGPHCFDLIRWWTGNDIKNVSASMGIIHPKRVTEDFVHATLEHENGMISYHHMTRVSYGYEHWQDTYRIYGSEGTMVVRNDHHFPTTSLEPCQIFVYSKGGDCRRLDAGRVWSLQDTIIDNQPFLNETKAFCLSIMNDTEPLVTGEDGMHTMEAVMAAYVSAWKGVKVDMPYREPVDLKMLFTDIKQRCLDDFGTDYTVNEGPIRTQINAPKHSYNPPRTKEKWDDARHGFNC